MNENSIPRFQRLSIVGLVALTIIAMMFAAPAAAQPDAEEDISLCDYDDETFLVYINNIIALIVYGGLILGTMAVVIGFASESSPFLDSKKYGPWKMQGMKYGWGLPIILYAMAFAMNVIGIEIACLLPGIDG